MDILEKLFNQVYIPYAVYDEIVNLGKGKAGWDKFSDYQFVIKKEVVNKMAVAFLQTQLGYGESEAIIFGQGDWC